MPQPPSHNRGTSKTSGLSIICSRVFDVLLNCGCSKVQNKTIADWQSIHFVSVSAVDSAEQWSKYFAFQSLKYKLKGNDYRGSLILICSKSHLNITKCVDSAPKSQLRPPWSRDKGKELSNGCSPPLLWNTGRVSTFSQHIQATKSQISPQPSPAQPSPSSQHLQQFGFRFRSQIPPQGF